jgi:hypothetical protein
MRVVLNYQWHGCLLRQSQFSSGESPGGPKQLATTVVLSVTSAELVPNLL